MSRGGSALLDRAKALVALAELHEVGPNGFLCRRRGGPPVTAFGAPDDRGEWPRLLAQFETAVAFLARLSRTKHPNERAGSSYGLKHAAERWGRRNGMEPYVCNGALLLAAFHLGFSVRRVDYGSPNGFLNVSTRSLRRLGDA